MGRDLVLWPDSKTPGIVETVELSNFFRPIITKGKVKPRRTAIF